MQPTLFVKERFFSALWVAYHRLLRPRRLIIVAEGTQRHYTISPRLQMAVLSAFVSLLVWSFFSTGVLFVAHAKLEGTAPVLTADMAPANGWSGVNMNALAGLDDDERIAALEQRVTELTEDREQLIQSFANVTEAKSQELEKIIASTGLSAQKLAKRPEVKKAVKEKMAGNTPQKFSSRQGGPYIPFDDTTVDQRVLMGQLDRLATLQTVIDKLPRARPIGTAQMMSGFGTRHDPFTRARATHTGLDFAAPHGARVLASSDGTVAYAKRHHDYGNMIDLSHGMGIVTRYGHLSKILVRPGQYVKKGQVIGIQGATGRATGEHLHYEVRYNDVPLNPQKFMKAGKARS